MKYGQNYYDFDEGLMTFFAPGQVVTTDINYDRILSGWWLVVHPDFIQPTSLAKKIAGYGFFSYAVYEALHLAEEEEVMLEDIIKKIAIESASPADRFSQNVIISYLELFLNYCNKPVMMCRADWKNCLMSTSQKPAKKVYLQYNTWPGNLTCRPNI